MMTTATIEKRNGTIANVLNKHQQELYAYLEVGDVKGCRKKALELLDDPSIKDRAAVTTAKKVFARPGDNLFMSCLVTYMSGVKVS